MKNRLNIFCNNNIKNFLPYFLSDYELTIMKLDQIKDKIQASQANIIIISKNDIDLRDYGKLNDNCLIISNLKYLNFNNKSNILNSPLSINDLKNRTSSITEDQGVIYTGNPKILKKICPGVFGTIKPVGYCMIGKR